MGVDFTIREADYERDRWTVTPVCFVWRDPKTQRKRIKVVTCSFSDKMRDKFGLSVHKIDLGIQLLIQNGVITEGFLGKTVKAKIRQLIFDFCNRHDEQDLETQLVSGVSKGDDPKKSLGWRLLAPTSDDSDGGQTFLIGGSSFSGKTFFLVSQLNKLIREEYDLIILMTESKNAKDLGSLRKDLPIVIIEGFRPDIIEKLKKINDGTYNRFRFMVILDDIVDQKNSKTLLKAILTFRNAGISTVVLIQYLKLINRAMRGSFHHVLLTGFRSEEDFGTAMEMFDLRSFGRDKCAAEMDRAPATLKKYEIAKWLKTKLSQRGVYLYLDQKHSEEPVFVFDE